MNHNFRSQLRSGEILIGTMITLPTAATAEILVDAGFDWLFVDGEHGPLELPDILSILQAVGHRLPCVVRVPAAEEVPIKKVLDLGAAGIIVPQVNTSKQAADVVQFARYAPEGQRGVGLGRAHRYGMGFQEYLDSANDQIAVIVQAEHRLAVENIDSIIQVDGIDAIQLGPYDLSASLGKIGQIDDPIVVSAMDRVTRACQSAGMPLGHFAISTETSKAYIEMGYTLISIGVDTLMLGSAAKHCLKQFRS